MRNENCTIYIVDDDESVRRALGRLFRSEGLNSAAFASGESFLAELPDGARGCVVMDISMPGLTGYNIQERLRERGHMIPVVALSAQDDDQACRRARELGAVAFLHKPVDDRALLDSVHWLLTSPEKPDPNHDGGKIP